MMSNFKIVHEIDGRLRVRFGQYAFTNEQATILKSDFLKLEYVRYVEAHYKNGWVTVQGAGTTVVDATEK